VGRSRVQIGDLVEGRYRILKELGAGGMGTVFLAEHLLIKRKVAMKVLHTELATDADVVERFMNEARAAGTLGHPNIVESTDMGFTEDHVPYVAFEYLEGTLLTDEIYRVGGLPVRRAVKIAQQIASALDAAHKANVVHRDLKSDNIFITDRDDALDHVKVLDFGIARFLAHHDAKSSTVMGTPEYMAPEQLTHPEAVDARADLYALGVILYEMLTARRPFTGDDVLEQIVHAPAPALDGELGPLVAQLLAKDPEHRVQSMLEVLEMLEPHAPAEAPRRTRSLPRIEGPFPRPATLPTQPKLVAPRRSWPLYAIAGLGASIGVVGAMLGLRDHAPPRVQVELRLDGSALEVGAKGYRTVRSTVAPDRPTHVVLEPGEEKPATASR